jgi:hypothetical protein
MIRNPFTAIFRDKAVRVSLEYSRVRLRKIGLLPRGFTIGNSALKIRKTLWMMCGM